MKRRISHVLLCAALLVGLQAPAWATEEVAIPTVDVLINGVKVEWFQAELHGGTSYVPFYGATLTLRPDAQIIWEDGQFIATAHDFTMTARIGDPYIQINGRYLYLPGGVKGWEDGTALVPARALATALGAWIGWNGRVEFGYGGVPLTEEGRPYDDETLDLVARVIQHESGNQPFRGKMAVGNVILNRVNDPAFPDTVYDVLFQKNQFPGATDAVPTEEAILAARLCLEGGNVVPNAFWFNGAGIPCWASYNKSLIEVIGDHAFYG